jgi:protein-S-isoprenylcysteine O-methyltransferase Ste14
MDVAGKSPHTAADKDEPELHMLATLELRLPPPLLTLITAIVMWVGARDNAPYPRPHWLTPMVYGVGIAAVIIFAAAIIALRRANTTVSPIRPDASRALVQTGVFSVTRNPIYLASILLLLAYALHLWQPQSFVAIPVFAAWIHRFQIIPEERALRAKFGDVFDQYAASTRRWI